MTLNVEPANHKPVICKKVFKTKKNDKGVSDKEELREGAIYYRYSSSCTEVKHAELKQMLDEKAKSQFTSLLENISLIQQVGLDKVAVVDATELSGADRTAKVYITRETARSINWIKKGHFSQTPENSEKAFFVTKEIEIRQGVEIEKAVDPGKTHTLTKTELTSKVNIDANKIGAILSKLEITGNSNYHLSGRHGKNLWHKFTETAAEKILANYPLDMVDRKEVIKKASLSYMPSGKKGGQK